MKSPILPDLMPDIGKLDYLMEIVLIIEIEGIFDKGMHESLDEAPIFGKACIAVPKIGLSLGLRCLKAPFRLLNLKTRMILNGVQYK